MQLEIRDQQDNSFLYNNLNNVPRVGEKITIFDESESANRAKEPVIIAEGTVKSVEWLLGNMDSDYTVLVKLE